MLALGMVTGPLGMCWISRVAACLSGLAFGLARAVRPAGPH
jgi:hypothetical protein